MVSQELLYQLEYQQSQNAPVGSIFIALQQPFLKCYTKYHMEYNKRLYFMKQILKENERFAALMNKITPQLLKNGKQTLQSYFIMPVQRVRINCSQMLIPHI